MDETATTQAPSYAIYFKVWLILLAVTILMVFVGSAPILVAGMAFKASLIALFFMHMKDETLPFALTVSLCIVGFSLVLFFLLWPDGRAM